MSKIILFLLLIAFLSSCGLVNHKRFTLYKQESKIEQSFKTDGVYFRFNEFRRPSGSIKYSATLYFFYKDGTFTSSALTMKNSNDKDIVSKLTGEFYQNIENSKGWDGAYTASQDSLRVQMFIGTQQRGIYDLDVVEKYFLIDKTNNSIELIHSFCEWCPKNKKVDFGNKIISENYNFFPLTNKPDSSKLWFKRTKWYKKEIDAKE